MSSEREPKPSGLSVEISGVNPPLEAIDGVDFLYLWCNVCAMTIATFGTNASPAEVGKVASNHKNKYHPTIERWD